MTTRRGFMESCAGASGLLLFCCSARSAEQPAVQAERPNILWLTIEDASPYAFGCYGNQDAATPTLDALAAAGIRFVNAVSNSPYCSPARSTLISGCYASAYGTDLHRGKRRVPAERYLFPALMRELGYFCTNNSKTDYNMLGEKDALGDVWDACDAKASYNSSARGPSQPFFSVFNNLSTHMSRLTTISVEGRDPPRRDPALLTLPPHVPDLPEIRADFALHCEGVEDIDGWVKLFLDDLTERGLREDTIIFFFSDHGGCLPRGKAFPYETGMRVPFIVYVPQRWRHLCAGYSIGTASERIVGFVDLAPTVLSLAGAAAPGYMQGRAFLGVHSTPPRRLIHGFRCNTGGHYDPSRTTFDGRYKYIRYYTPHKPHGLRQSFQWQMPSQMAWDSAYVEGRCTPELRCYYLPKPTEMLFDLEVDPWEMHNVADAPEQSGRLKTMRQQTSDWLREHRDLGFFPPSVRRTLNDKVLCDWVRDTEYPLDDLIAAAEMAGEGNPENVHRLKALLEHERPEFRFWGAAGAATLAQRHVIKSFPGGLQKAMRDANADVAVNAAEALCHLGRGDIALSVLVRLAGTGNGSAFSALEEVRDLAEPCLPAMEDLARNGPPGIRFRARSVLITHGRLSMDQLFEPEDRARQMAVYRRRLNWRTPLP